MKRIDQAQDTVASYSSSSAAASTPTLQYSNTPSLRLAEVEDEDENEAPIHFRGLSLELFARSVMNSETVLPKAVKTAGLNDAPIEWGLRQRRLAATISQERRVVSKQ